jgi:hypothetical protein
MHTLNVLGDHSESSWFTEPFLLKPKHITYVLNGHSVENNESYVCSDCSYSIPLANVMFL